MHNSHGNSAQHNVQADAGTPLPEKKICLEYDKW